MPDNRNRDQNLEDLTIRDLFALSPDSPSELAAGLEAEDYPAIEKAVSSLSEPIPWSRVQSEMSSVFSAALNTSLLDAWACAWKKCPDLKSDIEESRKSPDAVVLAGLAEHSVNSTLHPYIQVSLGPKVLQKITFDVTLTTQLKGVMSSDVKAGRTRFGSARILRVDRFHRHPWRHTREAQAGQTQLPRRRLGLA